jgi:peptide/nickel transport system substrate-binding protein
MRLVYLAAIINSVGAWVLWILLGLKYSQAAHGIASVGDIGMSRQFAFIAGALLVGAWADEGRPLLKNLWTQLLEGVIGLFILVAFLSMGDRMPTSFYPLWAIARYGLAGANFVLGFRVIGQASKTWGTGAIVHLLTAHAGMIFGPLLAIALTSSSLLSADPFLLAILLDCLSSIAYGLAFIPLLGSAADVRLPRSPRPTLQRVTESARAMWARRIAPWNHLHLLVLFATLGVTVYSMHVSQKQTWLPTEQAFALTTIVYGLGLWAAGAVVARLKDLLQAMLTGAALLAFSAILPLAVPGSGALWLGLVTYFFGYCLLFVGSNKGVLDSADPASVGSTRASMLLYLSVLAGLAEKLLGGWLGAASGSARDGARVFGFQRIGGALVIAALCLALRARRVRRTAVTATLATLIALAAAPATVGVQAAAAEGPIVYRRPVLAEIGEIDTRKAPSETDVFVCNQVFERLFKYNRNGEITGNLARNWKSKQDGRSFEIQLQPGVRFHQGALLKASDVKYTLERIRKAGGYVAASLSSLRSVTANDAQHSVTLTLKSPNPRFLMNLTDSNFSILQSGQESTLLNGTGPFRFLSRQPGELVLAKNTAYRGKVPQIDELRIEVMPKAQALQAYRRGSADDLFQFMLSADERDSLKQACAWTFEKLPSFRFVVIKNDTHPALRDRKLRTCLLSLLDREKLAAKLDPGQPVTRSSLPDGIFGGNLLSDYAPPPACAQETIQALARATAAHPIRIAQATTKLEFPSIIAELLAPHGIRTVAVPARDTDHFFALLKSPAVDLYSARFSPRAPDTESFLYAILGQSPFWPVGKLPPKLRSVTREIEPISDRQERSRAIAKAFTLLAQESVFVPLVQYEFNGCSRPAWTGTSVPLTGYIYQDLNLVSLKAP